MAFCAVGRRRYASFIMTQIKSPSSFASININYHVMFWNKFLCKYIEILTSIRGIDKNFLWDGVVKFSNSGTWHQYSSGVSVEHKASTMGKGEEEKKQRTIINFRDENFMAFLSCFLRGTHLDTNQP